MIDHGDFGIPYFHAFFLNGEAIYWTSEALPSGFLIPTELIVAAGDLPELKTKSERFTRLDDLWTKIQDAWNGGTPSTDCASGDEVLLSASSAPAGATTDVGPGLRH